MNECSGADPWTRARRERGGVIWYDLAEWLGGKEVVAAISTRRGGVSEGPLGELNLSGQVGDDPERVEENRRRFAATLDLDPSRVVAASQVHGASVARIDEVSSRAAPPPEADALVTNRSEVFLRLLFADCVPFLVVDPVRRVAGVGHGGWRGTRLGVAVELIRAMRDGYGCRPSDLRAVIGPAIGGCCYAVGPDVAAEFRAAWLDHRSYVREEAGRSTIDLAEANRRQLLGAGLAAENVLVAGQCTRENPSEFYSHRGQAGQAGRFGALIGWR